MRNNYQQIKRSGFRLLSIALVAIGLTGRGWAEEKVTAHARITYQVAEGIYVNVGSDAGLHQGEKGSLIFDNGRVFSFEVVQTARNSALLRLDGLDKEKLNNLLEQSVKLAFKKSTSPEKEATTTSQRILTTDTTEPFIPLLAPIKRNVESTSSKNIHHGRVGIRHLFQTDSDNGQDYSVTRLNTSGSLDRTMGSAWSLNWSGNLRYRAGDAYRDHPDYESLQPLIYMLRLQHPLDQGGFVRLGRFLPFELPGVGYLDGAQLEFNNGGAWRFGLLGGLKPDLNNLEVSPNEPSAGGYVTLESGQRDALYFSGTAGLLGTLFEGEADRLAVLVDQQISYGSKYNLFSSAEVDLGIADTTNSTTQLTRMDLTASARLHSCFTLRAGFDHWQRPDTLAQRDLLEVVDDRLFDDGYWRYWVGGRHNLPWNLRLNEEIAYTVSDATDDAVRWRVGLSRTGLFSWRSASVNASVYNLEAQGAEGMGSILSAYLPCWDGKLTIRPSTGLRWLEFDGQPDELSLTYYALYVDSRIAKSWILSGGLTSLNGDGTDSTQVDLGLRYRW